MSHIPETGAVSNETHRPILHLPHRLRRLRRNATVRSLVRETRLSPNILIYPLFVCEGQNIRREIPSMPGVFQLSVDEAVKEALAAWEDGVLGLILFGCSGHRDETGSAASDPEAPVQAATRAIKQANPKCLVITDACLCEYTSHGHCGIVSNEEIVNDATVSEITRVALSQAESGADIIAPSDMMDGRVRAIRETLDRHKFEDVAIMSYAAKYCSSLYGPFRDAVDSAPTFGDRRTHQMDPANTNEALREVELDIEEGADIVMVKPALHYLDVIYRVKTEFAHPTAAYHVSGEYSMLKAASKNNWVDEPQVMLECLTAIRRAGADIIITYYAREAARILRQNAV